MSTMTRTEALIEPPRRTLQIVSKSVPEDKAEPASETHPPIVVAIAAFIALNLTLGMIGSILIWLSLRHSGVAAP